ncbi:MAG: hypothetical protein A2W09_02615 [Deltaproteobacteria bacterium RBG_16_50_11]|nr:MAG: hypothetical protein A2W09_02615 [Deltaproteobacteria bacterium RBG_16_50_11]
MLKIFLLTLMFLTFTLSLAMANGDHPSQVTDPKEFKILKEKSIDPKTGLPKTLDPNLFKGKAKQAYQIAQEIPEVLAKMPCFCECEAFGHENLLDCFVDRHGAG